MHPRGAFRIDPSFEPNGCTVEEGNVRPGPTLTTEQRGWLVTALIVFLGVAYTGPAIARFNRKQKLARRRIAERASYAGNRIRATGKRAHRKVRRLGGGSIWR